VHTLVVEGEAIGSSKESHAGFRSLEDFTGCVVQGQLLLDLYHGAVRVTAIVMWSRECVSLRVRI
jgi:hypothetical protein